MNIKVKNISILFALVASLARGATPSPLPEWQVDMPTMSKLDLQVLNEVNRFLGPDSPNGPVKNYFCNAAMTALFCGNTSKRVVPVELKTVPRDDPSNCFLGSVASLGYGPITSTRLAEGATPEQMPAEIRNRIAFYTDLEPATRDHLISMLQNHLKPKVFAKVAEMEACARTLRDVCFVLDKISYPSAQYDPDSFKRLVGSAITAAKLIPEADTLRSYLARNPNLKSEKPEQVPFLNREIVISRLNALMLEADRLAEIHKELDSISRTIRAGGLLRISMCNAPWRKRIMAFESAQDEMISATRMDIETMLKKAAKAQKKAIATEADAKLAQSQMDLARAQPTRRDELHEESRKILEPIIEIEKMIAMTEKTIQQNAKYIQLLLARFAALIHRLDRARAPDTSAAADSDSD